jgi:two-component system response regulator PilR (NtrC family)
MPYLRSRMKFQANMSPRHKVLVVDDQAEVRALLEINLGRMNLHTQSARSLGEARRWLAAGPFDLCLSASQLPDGTGLELLQHIQQHHPQVQTAMISACGTPATVIEGGKGSCSDGPPSPLDLTHLRDLINRTLHRHGDSGDSPLLGDSTPMRTLRRHIGKLAQSQAPVYISGESGSGKELVARLIHAQGPRADQPWVPVNCGAIPTELMESEFFGHRKGSFSGAVSDQPGLFQAAHGGTLLLDEVADLPLSMQVKLLRALQEKAVRRVGSQQEVAVDVRILCATHKNLQAEVSAGRFRQDLYYRLNVIELRVPPLRERKDDIEPLARRVLQRLAAEHGALPTQLHANALAALMGYHFPGNVRELENLLERAYTLCDNRLIEPQDLGLDDHRPACARTDLAQVAHLDQHLQQVERELILLALEDTRWNRTAAAQRLGLSFRSMRYRMQKLGLD